MYKTFETQRNRGRRGNFGTIPADLAEEAQRSNRGRRRSSEWSSNWRKLRPSDNKSAQAGNHCFCRFARRRRRAARKKAEARRRAHAKRSKKSIFRKRL